MRTRLVQALATFAAFGALASVPALAGGAVPYYGFSGYYGGPATYYTHDTDVHQTTRMDGGSQAFGTRTYTAGGPFWHYKANNRTLHRERRRQARYIRVKG